MAFDKIIEKLQKAFDEQLPGPEAQLLMAPVGRKEQMIPPAGQARESGVLLLLYPGKETLNTVLILRPEYDGVHGGQVGFPGGKREEADQNITETALREAKEELGILSKSVNLLGHLTELYIPPSNALVTPVVGYSMKAPRFVPDEREVAAVIETEVFHFMHDANRHVADVTTRMGTIRDVPYFGLGPYRVWGATAMMLSEFSEILKRI